MQSGVPRSSSGGSSSLRSALTKDREETTREAALVTWLFLAGVGSSSKRKLNPFSIRPEIFCEGDLQWIQVQDDSYGNVSLGALLMPAHKRKLTIVVVEIRIVP